MDYGHYLNNSSKLAIATSNAKSTSITFIVETKSIYEPETTYFEVYWGLLIAPSLEQIKRVTVVVTPCVVLLLS
jgi:hypothetical protein